MTIDQDLADHYADLQAERSVAVTYARAAATVSLEPLPGKSEFERFDHRGTKTTYHSRDFLILATDLVISGSQTEPAAGDEITEDDGTTIHTFEVLPFGEGQPWRHADQHRTIYRIHTKRTGSTPS